MLDMDIRGFFDAIDHEWLMKFVEHRIADGRVLRLVKKWLTAGVLDKGAWSNTETGTPQGATISPLLANVFLHYVFDLWVQQWRRRFARGDVIVVRYADDVVLGFQHRDDAARCRADLQDRLRRFGLEVNTDKTRLIRFGKFAADQRRNRGEGKPDTFDFLGFTHICGKTRAGGFLLHRHTSMSRMRARLVALRDELRRRRHLPVADLGKWLRDVVRGYFAYHAVPTNIVRLDAFRTEVARHWHKALRRRSQRDRTTWDRTGAACRTMAPTRPRAPSISLGPLRRQDPRWEPSALAAHARICAGRPESQGEGRPYRDRAFVATRTSV